MTEKTKKRFGVWMDAHQATVVGCNPAGTEFMVVGQAKNPGPGSNSNENAANHREITLVQKYFKEIGRQLVKAEEVHQPARAPCRSSSSTTWRNRPSSKRRSLQKAPPTR